MKIYDPFDTRTTVVPSVSYALDRQLAYMEAEEHGLIVVVADDHTLQLDFDNDENFQQFLHFRFGHYLKFTESNQFAKPLDAPLVARAWYTESRNGNKHVYVTLRKPIPVTERIALQTYLGSDLTREFLNLMRVQAAVVDPVLFFEKPDAVEIVIYSTDGYQPQLTAGGNDPALEAAEEEARKQKELDAIFEELVVDEVA